jgi:type I restriction enzyme R subunit
MTGAASDPPAWQPHIGERPKARRELTAKRAKNAAVFRPDTKGGSDYRPVLSATTTPQVRLAIMAGTIDWVLTIQQADAVKETSEEGKSRAPDRR